MDLQARDIEYLNRFLADLWPGVADILMADITHRVFEEAWMQPGRISRHRTTLDRSARPVVSAGDEDTLRLRIPGSGALRLTTGIALVPWSPLPRILADVDFTIDVNITPDSAPVTQIDCSVHSNLVGTLIDQAAGWKDTIRRSFTGSDIERELGYFGAARYAPADVPAIPSPELIFPRRPLLDSGINIVLVPESFSMEQLPRFDQTVEAVVRRISAVDASRANEPFHSFKSALHVWTIKPEQTPEGDYVMGSFQDPRGHRRVALANLARLAAIGRAADAAGSGPTLLVFVVNPDAPRFDGRRPTAMALGNVVLQPLQRTPEEDASLLLHELGHTGLARLGDEYVLRSREQTRYLGRPLLQPNLTSDSELRVWRRWIDSPLILPEWDSRPVVGVEGAGYFGRGIWRPADDCAMRSSRDGIPFCAICREALTIGIQRFFGRQQVLLQVEQGEREPEYRMVSLGDQSPAVIDVPLPFDGTAPMSVTPVAATIPEPWEISAAFNGDGDVQRTVVESPEPGSAASSVRFTVTPAAGEILTLSLRSGCPFTPWDRIPDQSIGLRFQHLTHR